MHTACFRPLFQMPQLHPKDGALQRLHSIVEGPQNVVVLAVLPPVPQHANRTRVLGIVRGYRASLSVSSKILSGIETEAADVAEITCRSPSVFRPVCLRGIFDDHQSMTARHLDDRSHVRGLSVKMNRENGLGARRNRLLNPFWIKREQRRINVDEHCPRPNIANCRHAGDKCEGHGDYFIAWTHSRGQQSQVQCAGSGIQRDALRSSAIGGELFFKGSYVGAEYEVAALQHSGDGRIDLWLDAVVLRLQV